MWGRWVAFCSRTEVGTSLAVFRIAIGLCLLLNIGWVLGSGLLEVLWVGPAHGGMSVVRPGWLVSALGGATPGVMWFISVSALIAGAALVVGLGGRVTAFIAMQLSMAVVDINPLAGGSYDELLHNGLWLCVLGSTTATLSVDCRLKHGRWTSDTPVGVWARYLIVIQLVWVYTSTGWQKLSSYWTPGGDFSALYYILQQPSWQRFDMEWAAYVFPLTQLATAISWFWEVCAPIWLLAFYYAETSSREGRLRAWFNRWRVRWVYAAVGVLFHLGLLVLMEVGPFAPVTLAFYAALVHPGEYRRGS